MRIEIIEIDKKKYLSLDADVLVLSQFLHDKYKVFFLPTSKKDFEKTTRLEFVENKIFPFELVKDQHEPLVVVTDTLLYDLPVLCRGNELLEIENTINFKDNLIKTFEDDILILKDIIKNTEDNFKFEKINKFRADLIEHEVALIDFIINNL